MTSFATLSGRLAKAWTMLSKLDLSDGKAELFCPGLLEVGRWSVILKHH